VDVLVVVDVLIDAEGTTDVLCPSLSSASGSKPCLEPSPIMPTAAVDDVTSVEVVDVLGGAISVRQL